MIENLPPDGGGDMQQLNLFEAERPVAPPRPTNVAYVRKHLNRVLATVRAAQIMPWNPTDQRHWETFFPKLAGLLPAEEGVALRTAFNAEIARLRG
jgi:hypothetical protein